MSDLIYREDAKDYARHAMAKGLNVLEYLDEVPAADFRSVVRGRWIKPTRVSDSMLDECSVCGFDTGAYTFNFCPNCGAKMESEVK